MNILVNGMGSIGRRHKRLLESMGHTVYGVHDELWDHIHAVVISNPTNMHIETAIRYAQEWNPALFIEKPLDITSNQLRPLRNIVNRKHLTAYVAYPLRFLELGIELGIPSLNGNGPHKAEFICHTNAEKWPSVRTLDHVVWELSHEIDLAAYYLGPVRSIGGVSDPLGLRATLSLLHESGSVSIVDIDLASPIEDRYFEIDGIQHRIRVTDDLYIAQWQYFLNNISNPNIMNSLEEHIPLFLLIEEFVNGERAKHSRYDMRSCA